MASHNDDWEDPTTSVAISLQGGRSPKTWVLPNCQEVITQNGTTLNFVNIRKDHPWIYQSVVGPTAQNGALSRVKIIQELRDKVAAEINGELEGPAVAVAANDPMTEGQAVAVAANDPMALLDEALPHTHVGPWNSFKPQWMSNNQWTHGIKMRNGTRRITKKRHQKTKRRTVLARDKVCKITMPEYEPTRYPELTHHTREVTLMQGSTAREVLIEHTDVPWLLRWINAELPMPPVLDVTHCSIHGRVPPAVKWNRSKQLWYSTLTWETAPGPAAGQNYVLAPSCRLKDFTKDKWDVVDAIHQYGVDFDNTSFQERKLAARDYLYHILVKEHGYT